jgi:hypothetical protein
MFKATHKGRATTLSKTLLTAGLLGAAALSTLGAGSAQADEFRRCTFGTYTDSNPTCVVDDPRLGWQLGDKIFKMIDFGTLGTAGGATGLLSFIWNDFPPTGIVSPTDNWNVLVDFLPSVPPPSTGFYKYELSIAPAYIAQGYTFKDVELDVNHSGSGQTVTKEVSDVPTSPLISVDGDPVLPQPFNPNTTLITVTDSWVSNPDTGRISSISNVYTQVPAPLPLLGVGAVFGSIRKLRKFSSQLKTFSLA